MRAFLSIPIYIASWVYPNACVSRDSFPARFISYFISATDGVRRLSSLLTVEFTLKLLIFKLLDRWSDF